MGTEEGGTDDFEMSGGMQEQLAERHPPIVNPIPDPTTEEEWAQVHHRPCRVCGLPIEWTWAGTLQGPLLHPDRHKAPCGRGCRGAGVSPKQAEGGMLAFHDVDSCGEPECPGGMRPSYLPAYGYVPISIDELRHEVPWKRYTETRSECFMAPGEPYTYTYGKGIGVRSYTSIPLVPVVGRALRLVNEVLAKRNYGLMNGCFLNRYDHEREHLGWHADDFEGMDHDRPVVVMSFGAERELWWRRNGDEGVVPPERRIRLESGSLLIMPPGFQHKYQHRIPKGDRPMDVRISLTFRAFK